MCLFHQQLGKLRLTNIIQHIIISNLPWKFDHQIFQPTTWNWSGFCSASTFPHVMEETHRFSPLGSLFAGTDGGVAADPRRKSDRTKDAKKVWVCEIWRLICQYPDIQYPNMIFVQMIFGELFMSHNYFCDAFSWWLFMMIVHDCSDDSWRVSLSAFFPKKKKADRNRSAPRRGFQGECCRIKPSLLIVYLEFFFSFKHMQVQNTSTTFKSHHLFIS